MMIDLLGPRLGRHNNLAGVTWCIIRRLQGNTNNYRESQTISKRIFSSWLLH